MEHTAENPYCGDPDCWCHSSVSYHEEVTDPASNISEEDISAAYEFFGVEPVVEVAA